MIFLPKKGPKYDFSQENNLFFPTFTYSTNSEKGPSDGLQHDMDKKYFDAERSEAKKF